METGKRPSFLSALCILTFLISGLGFLGYFFLSVFFDQASEFIISIGNVSSMNGITPLYFILFMVLHAVSLSGAIRMWGLHKDGYFTYVVAQVLVVALPAFILGWVSFSYTSLILAVVFIVGYSFNLKMLK